MNPEATNDRSERVLHVAQAFGGAAIKLFSGELREPHSTESAWVEGPPAESGVSVLASRPNRKEDVEMERNVLC